MDKEKLKEILDKHKKWLMDKEGGAKADLCGADLCGANLRGADLREVKTNECTAFFHLQCPEKGTYTAFKKAGDYIVELEIPADAMRSSATTRKCRASKAKVISITSVNGEKSVESIASNYDSSFIYKVGETAEALDFNTDRRVVRSANCWPTAA